MAKSKRSKSSKKRSRIRSKLEKQHKKKINEFLRDYKPNPQMMNDDGSLKPLEQLNPSQASIYKPNRGSSVCLPGVRAKDFEI